MTGNSAAAVLRAVLELGPVPRSVVARHVGVSPATVTWQSRSLLEAGLLIELPEPARISGSGRPCSPLALDSAGNVVIAVHIAAAQTTVAVVDIAGTVLGSTPVPHRGTDPDVVLDAAAAAITRVRAQQHGHRVLAVGVATGGRVDRVAGVVAEHSFLRWRDVPVRDRPATTTPITPCCAAPARPESPPRPCPTCSPPPMPIPPRGRCSSSAPPCSAACSPYRSTSSPRRRW